MVEIITRYEYDKRPTPGIIFDKKDPLSKSKTVQADKDASDINKIMERYEKTGYMPVTDDTRKPTFGDFSDIGDFYALTTRVAEINQMFMLLPASVRNRFDNNVQNLLNFMADNKNDEESVKMGLKDKSVLEKPLPEIKQTPSEKPATEPAKGV